MCGVVRGGVVWCVVCGVLECCSIYIVAQWFYFEVKNIVYFYTKTKHLYISIDINVFGGFKMNYEKMKQELKNKIKKGVAVAEDFEKIIKIFGLTSEIIKLISEYYCDISELTLSKKKILDILVENGYKYVSDSKVIDTLTLETSTIQDAFFEAITDDREFY